MPAIIDGSVGSQFPTTIGVGNATPSTSGAGITFPATQSASTDANTLDDYEEGTWTPSVSFAGTTTGITYSEQTGKYTKVGNQVTVMAEIVLTNKGSASGRLQIGGVPFTSTNNQYTSSIELRNVTFTQKYAIAEIGRASGTYLRVIFIDTATGSSELLNTGVANNSAFFITATYFV